MASTQDVHEIKEGYNVWAGIIVPAAFYSSCLNFHIRLEKHMCKATQVQKNLDTTCLLLVVLFILYFFFCIFYLNRCWFARCTRTWRAIPSLIVGTYDATQQLCGQGHNFEINNLPTVCKLNYCTWIRRRVCAFFLLLCWWNGSRWLASRGKY